MRASVQDFIINGKFNFELAAKQLGEEATWDLLDNICSIFCQQIVSALHLIKENEKDTKRLQHVSNYIKKNIRELNSVYGPEMALRVSITTIDTLINLSSDVNKKKEMKQHREYLVEVLDGMVLH